MMDSNTQLTFVISADETDLILQTLSKLKWYISNPLILKLQKQAQAQLVEAAIPKDIAVEKPSDVGL